MYNNPHGRIIYTSIEFDEAHKIKNSNAYFKNGWPNSTEMNAFVAAVIERFAKELKLVGKYEINVDFYRIRYLKEAGDMKWFQLDWHYDRYAKCSMVGVFQNDFPYTEGETAGLDIAENDATGPFDPLKSHSDNYYPKNGHISCRYPQNGALLFKSVRGKFIHRRSILAEPKEANATRSVIQIKLKDCDWPELL